MSHLINKNNNTNEHRNRSVAVPKLFATCLVLIISMQMCCGSAIPIWEYLTRNEKMSFLYSTFGQLVSVHCKATAATTAIPVNQCKHDLLTYGYEKLQTFTDQQLDQLDPYQRSSNELIWSSIMRDHPSSTLITTRKPLLSTPSESSIIILTHQKAPGTVPTATLHSKNPLFDSEVDNKRKLAMDMDKVYDELSSQKPHTTDTFLSGPLVFRVRPDGTPVEEDKHRPLPYDDDLDGYKLSSFVIGNSGTLKSTTVNTDTPVSDRPKHRKIAMISDLKQQHLASMALQRDLQPPYEQMRAQQQYQQDSPNAPRPISFTQTYQNAPSITYYFAQGQA